MMWDIFLGLPWWFSGKESSCSGGPTGDMGLIPGLERSPGGEHGNPLQYSCLENPMDRGAWWAIVHRVTSSQTQLKRLGLRAYICFNNLETLKHMKHL